MANGITLNVGSGGKTVETTELDSGRQVESIQLALIIDGVAVRIDDDNPLPVKVVGGTAYGKRGLYRADLAAGDVVLTDAQAAYHIIVAENSDGTRRLTFPEVFSDEQVYTRLVRNTSADLVTIVCGANEYALAGNSRIMLDFEPTQIIGSFTAF